MDHFDFIARWYDRLIGGPGDLQDLAGMLALGPGAWLLDVGGGTGRVTGPLSDAGARAIICDRSTAMLQQAHAKGLTAVQASVDRLPFRSSSVDAALVVDAFHHFTQPSPQVMQPQAAAELVRVLAVGGRLVIQEPDIRRPLVKLMALGEKALQMGSRFLTSAQMATLLRGLGARSVEIRKAGFSYRIVVRQGPDFT